MGNWDQDHTTFFKSSFTEEADFFLLPNYQVNVSLFRKEFFEFSVLPKHKRKISAPVG